MANTRWTDLEVEATVADYLAMLVKFHAGQPLNKAEHSRALRKVLDDRSAASVDFKRRNISAVLHGEGLDYLDGYVPAFNYQARLQVVVAEQLQVRPDVLKLLDRIVEEEAPAQAEPASIIPDEVRPPRPLVKAARERYIREPRARKVDYDAIEARNRSLGAAGELAALAFEHHRLWTAGKRTLAERIEHVAQSKGDGLGYDIHSFELSGAERLIEVKTTRRAELTPFYLTRNEVRVSQARTDAYFLYRLYRFELGPKLFMLHGDLARTCRLEPTAYRAEVA